MKTQTFALCFGNRGFFPESLIASAREEVSAAVRNAGYEILIPDASLTRYGAVEGKKEGEIYAKWLKSHEGEYDGVIFSLPNFSDENGAIAALQNCGTPILLQAYPDEIGKMDFEHRRDSYCGKFSICDVFHQYGLPFTIFEPHVVHPSTEAFRQNIEDFAAVCRVVKGMKRFTMGVIGARTTKFKTVRFDEITLQKYGITTDTYDLSELFFRMKNEDEGKIKAKIEALSAYSDFSGVPEANMRTLAAMSAAIDDMIAEYGMDALALRCWDEMHDQLHVAPCVLLGELNHRGIPASCEIDVCSGIAMRALSLAANKPATVLDWNNNYGDDPEKVILFHCGPVATDLMTDKGVVTDHKMFSKNSPGCGWGSCEGRIAPTEFTYANCRTEEGKLSFYADEGIFTDDPIEAAFFGCGGVAKIDGLQKKLLVMAKNGYRHHTAVGAGRYAKVLNEAFTTYLNYDIDLI